MLGHDTLSLVVKRADFVEALADRPLEKREMTTELDYSRATVNRAIGALEDADLVRETPAGYEPTLAARLAVDAYREFVATGTDVVDAGDVLGSLDHDADVAPGLLRDATRFPVAEAGTYANFERVRERIASAGVVDVVVPGRRALPAVDHWQNALVGADEATVVLDDALHEAVEGSHRSLSWLADQGVSVLAGDAPPFVLVRADGDQAGTVFVLAFDDDAGEYAAIRNDAPAAVSWATDVLEAARADATGVDDAFAAGFAASAGGDAGDDAGVVVPVPETAARAAADCPAKDGSE